jgi:septal ring factor EnvC (AmiA/AmiB activator)
METTDPYSHQSVEGQSEEQGSKLNISPVQSAHIEPHDAHWLRMDPSLTRAVLAKTEEELLGSLAALMRNKVEHEQASRRFAQIQIDSEQTKHELETIKEQIRRAEGEVATRLNEQSRINEEIDRVRQELAILREDHQQYSEMVSSLKNEAAQKQQLLAEAHRNLSNVKEAAETQLAAYRETIAQLAQVKNEKAALEQTLAPLQAEVDERIKAREALIQEAIILHEQVSNLATHQEQQAAKVSELGTSHAELQKKVEGLRAEHGSLVSEIENLSQSVARHDADKERRKAELSDLHKEIAGAAGEQRRLQQSVAEELAHVSDLLARKGTLEQGVAEAADKQRAMHAEAAALESRLHELSEAAEKAEQARIAEGLPLLFGAEVHHVAPEWDPYRLESEFHTDEKLDAKMVAKLVSMLPGLEGCLIVKNHGPVLASQLPERIHTHLNVPDRNYHLLFERLAKKVKDYHLQQVRLATFDLGAEALTVAQANQAFVFVNHRLTKLRPGMPDKLASIVSEVAKMYP